MKPSASSKSNDIPMQNKYIPERTKNEYEDVQDPDPWFGEIILTRRDLASKAVHKNEQASIHAIHNKGALSILLDPDVPENLDLGDTVFFKGCESHLGMLTGTNKALALNCYAPLMQDGAEESDEWKKGKPVRVIRMAGRIMFTPYAPKIGYRYDGFYKVLAYRYAKEYEAWMFTLQRDDVRKAPWCCPNNQLNIEFSSVEQKMDFLSEFPPTIYKHKNIRIDYTESTPKAVSQSPINTNYSKHILISNIEPNIKLAFQEQEINYIKESPPPFYHHINIRKDYSKNIQEFNNYGCDQVLGKNSRLEQYYLEPSDSKSISYCSCTESSSDNNDSDDDFKCHIKPVRRKRGKMIISDVLLYYMQCDVGNKLKWDECLEVAEKHNKASFLQAVLEHFSCNVCQDLLNTPVHLHGVHTVCQRCVRNAPVILDCAQCWENVYKEENVNEYLMNALLEILPPIL